MKKSKLLLLSTLLATTISSAPLYANPTAEILANYSQAAEGDKAMVESVYNQLNVMIDQQGAKPLTMIYLGSTQTLQGRDAFLPWNKMKYTEKGLATMAKGIGLLDTLPEDINQQERIQGLPEAYLAQAMAAVTYTSLPDMFNHFDRGYDMYLNLLNHESFVQQPFAASAWIYHTGIVAALKADDLPQAQVWLDTMESLDAHNPLTQTAKSLVASQG
ncbi:hypothetical protein [Vibrio renipiscarius]|uniref:Uncharacterized protein n=1 Tax=Vibrio renipiscarius TaxID=1461322 RepID=A0A0C2NXF5_9VIBR|nr:hypothetical protein [Vibrio renipiscarius]KII79572.1 hypothetical protein PL18_07900 [Vibrio renipiscarius]KII80800.1 hypothetical protein OJ16_05765 [Vibrio renipiscarius]